MSTTKRTLLYGVARKYDGPYDSYNINDLIEFLQDAKDKGVTEVSITRGDDYVGCNEWEPNGTMEFEFYSTTQLTDEQARLVLLEKELNHKQAELERMTNMYRLERDATRNRLRAAEQMLKKTLEEHVPKPDFDAMQREIDAMKAELDRHKVKTP